MPYTTIFVLALSLLFSGCAASLPEPVRRDLAASRPGHPAVVVFVDFECPYCRRQHAVLGPQVRAHGSPMILHHVPLAHHPHARRAAAMAICAERQGAAPERIAEVMFEATAGGDSALDRAPDALGLDRPRLQNCLLSSVVAARLRADGEAFQAAAGEGVPLTYVGPRRLDGATDEATTARAFDDSEAP